MFVDKLQKRKSAPLFETEQESINLVEGALKTLNKRYTMDADDRTKHPPTDNKYLKNFLEYYIHHVKLVHGASIRRLFVENKRACTSSHIRRASSLPAFELCPRRRLLYFWKGNYSFDDLVGFAPDHFSFSARNHKDGWAVSLQSMSTDIFSVLQNTPDVRKSLCVCYAWLC